MMQPAQLTIRSGIAASGDYDRFAELMNAVDGSHTTGDSLREWDNRLTEGTIRHRYAACIGDEIIGYGLVNRYGSARINQFLLWLTIDSKWRGQGVGSQFYAFLRERAMSYQAVALESFCRDNDPLALAFAQKRGYTIRRHAFGSELDLTALDDSPFQAWIDRAEAGGIRFSSLAAEGNTEAARRKLYDLNYATMMDNPSSDGTYTPTFEQFTKSVFDAAWFRPNGQILAVDGERYVGLGAVGIDTDDPQTAFNAYTGVDRDYRGRGIAQALKLLALRFARSQGAHRIITDNDSENTAMLAVNRKLGYQVTSGEYQLIQRDPA